MVAVWRSLWNVRKAWLHRRMYTYIAHHELGGEWDVIVMGAERLSTGSIGHLFYAFSRTQRVLPRTTKVERLGHKPVSGFIWRY